DRADVLLGEPRGGESHEDRELAAGTHARAERARDLRIGETPDAGLRIGGEVGRVRRADGLHHEGKAAVERHVRVDLLGVVALVDSLLYDIPPKEGSDPRATAKAGIANLAKLKPAPLYRAADAARISPCEYEADAGRLAECDLVIEVVAEVLGIKKKVFGWVA